MHRQSLSLLLIAGVIWTFAPIVSGSPPERGERDGHPPRGERERGVHDQRGDRTGPASHHGPGGPGFHRGPGDAPEPGRMMAMLPIVAALDADKDGNISNEEIENASAALKKLDKNDDGKIDRSEMRPQFDRHFGRQSHGPRDAHRSPHHRERGDMGRHSRGHDSYARDSGGRRSRERSAHGRGSRGRDMGGHHAYGHVDRRAGQHRERGTHARMARHRDNEPKRDKQTSKESGPESGLSLMTRLMKLDQNEDGALSANELSKLGERGERLIKIGDRDEDGSLSSDELAAMKDRGKQMRREHRKSGGKELKKDKNDEKKKGVKRDLKKDHDEKENESEKASK